MNTLLENELEIIEKAKKKPEEFRPLYEQYYEPIFRYIYNRTGDYDITCELASNTFYNAMTKLNTYTYKGYSIKSWLYKIAYNQMQMHFRKTQTHFHVSVDEKMKDSITEELIDSDGSSKLASEHLTLEYLIQAFDQLNDSEMEYIEMKYFEGLSHDDISQIQGISISNAKVRLHRSLKKLKTALLEIIKKES